MKLKFINFVVIIAALLPNSIIGSDSVWKEFLNLREKYYCIDTQKFEKLSCSIEVPLINNLIKQMKLQLEPMKNNIEIKENLSEFKLFYTKNSGLTFTDPTIEIIVLNEKGIADMEKFKKGVSQIKTGFNQQINGVKSVIKSIIDDYKYPEKEKFKDLVINNLGDSVIVKYRRENYLFAETYYGQIIKGIQTGNSSTIKYMQKYIRNVDNKLIMEYGTALNQTPIGTVNMNVFVEYQVVSGITFPKHIKSEFEQIIQTISHKGLFDIYLKDLTIN